MIVAKYKVKSTLSFFSAGQLLRSGWHLRCHRRPVGGATWPSRLADALDVPIGEQNELLLIGGFAPRHSERDFDDEQLLSVMAMSA